MAQYKLDRAGHIYKKEIAAKCHYEVIVEDDKAYVILRGGALEPIVLKITGQNLQVDDWWGWGT